MGFKQAVTTCFIRKYVDFRGRASRSEYWYFVLANFLLGVAVGLVCAIVAGKSAVFVGVGLMVLVIFLPSLAAQVRRLHDTNSSGWWVLLGCIPYVGGLIMVVWYCIKGTAGENRFGPDPLNPDTVEAFD
jgi:uncharacterized membrane protein YhaH (DUF805 family)